MPGIPSRVTRRREIAPKVARFGQARWQHLEASGRCGAVHAGQCSGSRALDYTDQIRQVGVTESDVERSSALSVALTYRTRGRFVGRVSLDICAAHTGRCNIHRLESQEWFRPLGLPAAGASARHRRCWWGRWPRCWSADPRATARNSAAGVNASATRDKHRFARSEWVQARETHSPLMVDGPTHAPRLVKPVSGPRGLACLRQFQSGANRDALQYTISPAMCCRTAIDRPGALVPPIPLCWRPHDPACQSRSLSRRPLQPQ